MKFLLLSAFLAAALAVGVAQANAILSVSGKLTSITPREYVVETKNSLVYIDRKAISKEIANTITRTEIPVVFTIPLEAINKIKQNQLRPVSGTGRTD